MKDSGTVSNIVVHMRHSPGILLVGIGARRMRTIGKGTTPTGK